MGLMFTSIRVRDVKKAVAFYTRSLGMRITDKKSYMPGELVISLISPDTGQKLRLMYYAENCALYKPYEKGDEMDHLAFEVKDARKTFNRLVAKGAPVAMPLRELKERTMGYIKDPDGIWIGLISKNKKGGKKR